MKYLCIFFILLICNSIEILSQEFCATTPSTDAEMELPEFTEGFGILFSFGLTTET